MWAHIYVHVAGSSPDPRSSRHRPLGTSAAHHPLVKLVKRKRAQARKNLLSGEYKEGIEPADAALLNLEPEL